MRTYLQSILPTLIALALVAFGGDPRDDQPNPEPAPHAVALPKDNSKEELARWALESLAQNTNTFVKSPELEAMETAASRAATNAPAKAPETQSKVNAEFQAAASAASNAPQSLLSASVKAPAIVCWNCYVIEVNGQKMPLIPERYWGDLTNIYKSTFVKKVTFLEP